MLMIGAFRLYGIDYYSPGYSMACVGYLHHDRQGVYYKIYGVWSVWSRLA